MYRVTNLRTRLERRFITLGLGSSLVSRMVLNLRSWSQTSANYGDDAGWRYDFPVGTDRTHEMHSMVELGNRGTSRDVTSGGLDISVHIDGPNKTVQPTYRREGSKRGKASISKQHRIVIETETIVLADEEDQDDADSKKPTDGRPPGSIWFADAYTTPKRTGRRHRSANAYTSDRDGDETGLRDEKHSPV